MTSIVLEGPVSGRIVDLDGASVSEARVLLFRGDELVKTVLADKGSYTLTGVKAGVYSLIAVTRGTFAVTALQVLKSGDSLDCFPTVHKNADITLVEGKTFQLLLGHPVLSKYLISFDPDTPVEPIAIDPCKIPQCCEVPACCQLPINCRGPLGGKLGGGIMGGGFGDSAGGLAGLAGLEIGRAHV